MAIEAAIYIHELDETLPDGSSDRKSEGDNVLKLLKAVLKTTLSGIRGAVTATHLELNTLVGATGSGASLKVTTQTIGSANAYAASCAYVDATVGAAAALNLPAVGPSNEGSSLQSDGSSSVAWGTTNPAATLALFQLGGI